MNEPLLDPELALPWQKLAAALAALLGPAASSAAPRPGLDAHEARAQAIADRLVRDGVLAASEMASRMAALAVRLAGDKDRAHPKARFSNARPNDIGGLPGGPIDTAPGTIADWEMLAVALCAVLGQRRLASLHERRRAVEDMGEDYHRRGYFERMVQGAADVLHEKGVLTREEVEHKIRALRDARR